MQSLSVDQMRRSSPSLVQSPNFLRGPLAIYKLLMKFVQVIVNVMKSLVNVNVHINILYLLQDLVVLLQDWPLDCVLLEFMPKYVYPPYDAYHILFCY